MSQARLTKKAYEEMEEQLRHLKTVRRKELSTAVGEAREHGDLKENSAYHEAKKDQGLNEAKIARLEEQLKHAQVIEESEIQHDVVSLGSKVRLKRIGTKDIVEYTVVSEIEADIFKRKISENAPLGSALLNCAVNDVVEVDAPDGIIKYKILEIKGG